MVQFSEVVFYSVDISIACCMSNKFASFALTDLLVVFHKLSSSLLTLTSASAALSYLTLTKLL